MAIKVTVGFAKDIIRVEAKQPEVSLVYKQDATKAGFKGENAEAKFKGKKPS